MNYTGGASYLLSVNDNVPFTITANQQGFTMSAPTITGYSSGSGTSGSPYVFSGNTTTQKVTLNLTNTGTNPISITGIQDNVNSFIYWLLSDAQSTCYNNTNLQPNASCTIVYNNVLASNVLGLGNVGSSITENLIMPTIIFQDKVATSTQFQEQPTLPSPLSGTTLYADASLATIANTTTVTGGGTANPTVKVQSVLSNALSYSPITVTSMMEAYFTSTTPTVVGPCSQSSESGIVTQVCTFNGSGSTTGSITYAIESGFIESQPVNLHNLFTMTTSSQVVGMNPLYITTLIPEY